ncbi:MAG: PSD1 and planctomycete cytochrome C domain-containing protein [Verrucomicrobiales bacterium]|nr:PSD1 and planctomycete cytochrome C domain-containing protein [Verrucomicrobiales bacterium]
MGCTLYNGPGKSGGVPVGGALLSFLLVATLFAQSVVGEESGKIRFNRDIRPILSDNCYYCHGPDEKTQEADLRIDTFEGATRDLGGYAAIVPGKPEESELYLRITDHDDLMPPPKSKKTLSKEEIALVEKWIEEGAEYEPHWSFMPIDPGELPKVENRDWPGNLIDNYILSQLEEHGVAPSPPADRATLIRRLYIDLLGLLPSPEEVDKFVSDESPDAYDTLVDSLLANSHYGERWGRHWLDQARYADSNGYSIDSLREMWPYRDWVIEALNRDMPFDQFTIEQLAGDLLPKPTKMQQIATGFHRNTLINQEGGSDKEQFRVEAAIDRVATTGAVWLGLTVGCAQCHTHKFDPITHREFFELYAFFNSTSDQNNPGKTLEVRRGEVFGKPVKVDSESQSDTSIGKLKATWEAKQIQTVKQELAKGELKMGWTALRADSVKTSSLSEVETLPGNSYLIKPGYGGQDSISIQAKSDLEQIGGVRLRVLPHKSLPKNGPGTAGNGNFVLSAFEVKIGGKPVKVKAAFADQEQSGYPVLGAIHKEGKGWAINAGPSGLPMNTAHEAVFVFGEPIKTGGKAIEITLRHDVNANYLIGHFAVDVTEVSPREPTEALQKFLAALEKPESKRAKLEKTLIKDRFEATEPRAKLSKKPADRNVGRMMVMQQLSTPRDTYLLTRGDFTRPDKELGKLHPGGLSHVAPFLPAKAGQNRLDLAKWLIDPQNPLTPRVTMNRVWMRYFGRGLVETEEDFGTQGSLPSHPELLDWLGATFIEKGWSMKAMHRLIVTSATYRQSSHTRADLSELDPWNYWLARQNRSRVDAEIVRDAALCASGLFTDEIGGPGVYPPQPDGVYAFTQSRKNWNTSKNADRYRRAMYTVFFRSAPYPLFTTFDAPDFSSVCTRRVKSNTPLQALNIANDPVFIELAQALALRIVKEAPDSQTAQIHRGFNICLSRNPTQLEQEVLLNYIKTQEAAYQQELESAKSLSSSALLAELDNPAKAASLVSFARVLFNLDNFITRE